MALSIGELVGYVDLDTSKAEGAAESVGGMFKGLGGKWGTILGGVGVAAGGLFAAGLGAAMSAEPASDKLAAQLGSVDTEKWGAIAGSVYSNGFGAGLEDVNAAIGAVVTSIKGMRTASDADVQAMTEKAMTFADVMEVDVTRAAEVAGVMMQSGLAKDGGQAFDLLMAASQKVPASLREDVLDATEEYGQFFSALGIKGPEAMGLLAKGAEKGMYGIDKTGDALKEFTILATDGSEKSRTAMESMGLPFAKLENQLLAGGNTANKAFGKIVGGLLDIEDPSAQATAAIALFGAPMEDLGTKDIPKFLKSLQGGEEKLGAFAGSVDKAGATAYDNAATNLSMFGRGLKTHFVEMIGGSVLPVVTSLTGLLITGLGPAFDTAASAVKAAGGFLDEHKTTLTVVAGVIAAVFIPHLVAMGIASTIAAAQVVVSWVLTQTWALIAAASHSVAVVGMVAGWVLIGVQSLLGAAKVAASWLIAMGPIGLVIALVVGLVAIIVANWDTIKSVTGKVWDWISGKVSGAWDAVRDKTSAGIAAVVGFVQGIPDKFTAALASLGSTVSGLFRDAMDAGKEKVVGIGGTIMDWITAIPGKLLGQLGAFSAAGRGLLQGFVDGMKNAAGLIAGIAGNVWDTVKGMINGAITQINRGVEFTISVAGKDFGINPPDIPQLATGGRATASTLAVIGEGREPETVLPDSVLRGLLDKAHAAGASQGTGGNGRNAPLIGQVVQSAGQSVDDLAESLWFKTRTRG